MAKFIFFLGIVCFAVGAIWTNSSLLGKPYEFGMIFSAEPWALFLWFTGLLISVITILISARQNP